MSTSSSNIRAGQMSLGMNILGFGAHAGAWRTAEVAANAYLDVEYYRNIARISELGVVMLMGFPSRMLWAISYSTPYRRSTA